MDKKLEKKLPGSFEAPRFCGCLLAQPHSFLALAHDGKKKKVYCVLSATPKLSYIAEIEGVTSTSSS